MRPSNIAENEDGDIVPNPDWYEGTEWSFRPNGKGEYKLSLNSESGRGVKIYLTGEQAAKLLYAAQAGELDDYGDSYDR